MFFDTPAATGEEGRRSITTIGQKGAIGIQSVMIQILWFSILSLILSRQAVLEFFRRAGRCEERTMGLVLMGLGLKLAFLSGHE